MKIDEILQMFLSMLIIRKIKNEENVKSDVLSAPVESGCQETQQALFLALELVAIIRASSNPLQISH